MKIDINKDFEDAFPDEFYSGFTFRQCMAAAAGFLASFATAFLLWRFAGLPVVECTYLALPLMLPFCAAGFFRYQCHGLWEIIRAVLYTQKTKELPFAAGELNGKGRKDAFTMKRAPGPSKHGKKKARAKKGRKGGMGHGRH